jgi:pimeloyl-ACP methyl ester carboxylesterase
MIWLLLIPAIYFVLLIIIAWKSAFPVRVPIFIAPGQLDAPQERVTFTTRDHLELTGWWISSGQAETVFVFIHGYMMNRSELTATAYMLWRRGADCLLFDLRAHGDSGGKMTGFGWIEREDVRAAVEFARTRNPGAKVVLVGSSMGGAAAAVAVAEDRSLADALILDSTYSRLDWAAMGWWRFIGGKFLMVLCAPTLALSRLMLRFRLRDADVADALSTANKPTLLLHGDSDRLALPFEAERNHAACNGNATLVWFERCNHSGGRYFRPEEYNAALYGWLEAQGHIQCKSSASEMTEHAAK